MPNKHDKVKIEGAGCTLTQEQLEAITIYLLDKKKVVSTDEFNTISRMQLETENELIKVKALKDPIIKLRNRLNQDWDLDQLYDDYVDSATTKGGMNECQFNQFVGFIEYVNSVINGQTTKIAMKGDMVNLTEIPFDSRLKCLLTPVAITYDIYDSEMTDFKVRRGDLRCDITLEDWISLQQKFFRNWRGKKADETNTLKDLVERATIQQVGRRAFYESGTEMGSNYFIPNAGEIYQMPVKLPFILWDANDDCIKYNQAIRRTYLGLFDRLADINK